MVCLCCLSWPRILTRSLVVPQLTPCSDGYQTRIHIRFPRWLQLQPKPAAKEMQAEARNRYRDSIRHGRFCHAGRPVRVVDGVTRAAGRLNSVDLRLQQSVVVRDHLAGRMLVDSPSKTTLWSAATDSAIGSRQILSYVSAWPTARKRRALRNCGVTARTTAATRSRSPSRSSNVLPGPRTPCRARKHKRIALHEVAHSANVFETFLCDFAGSI